MTDSDTYSRPSKGILKMGKHAPLTRSASLQSKRTCFKEERLYGDVGGLSSTFNMGCSLDVPDEDSIPIDHSFEQRKKFEQISNLPSEPIAEDVNESGNSMSTDHQDQHECMENFKERRKSFELKPLGDTSIEVAGSGNVQLNLRAILAHKIPELDNEDELEDTNKMMI